MAAFTRTKMTATLHTTARGTTRDGDRPCCRFSMLIGGIGSCLPEEQDVGQSLAEVLYGDPGGS
jgi:hypothetical protein